MANERPSGMIQGAAMASGKYASAQCPVCSDVIAYKALRKRWDGQFVCRSCLDPKHPAEMRRSFKDAVALHHPRIDNSKVDENIGFGLYAITYDSAGTFTVVIS